MTNMLPVNPNHEPSNKQLFHHVPEHWTIRRIRTIAEMRVSNVDKHTNEQEIPVRLCNYVDVYYHDHINSDLPYMYATASYAEVQRFRLKPNDVLITKDSETWNDIAVPALVTDPPNDLICGYHLAILRPTRAIEGAYLARALQTRPVAHQFHVKARGITRYGLSHDDILSTSVPLPPLEEQRAIVRYLDHTDEIINRYISAKERLIALLEEQRQAVIHQTVTRGLDSSVLLKPSGVPWIGDIPDHWSVRRLRTLAHISTGGKDTINSVENGRYPFFVRSQTVEKINSWSFDGEAVLTAGDGVGVGRVFHYINGKFDYHQRVYKFSDFTDIDGKLFYHYFSSMLAFQTSQGTAKSTVDSLRLPMLQNFPVVVPLPAEQNRLVQELDRANANTQGSINRAYRQIDLMNEYRTRLIADVVTGQLDVRSADANDLDMLEAHS